MWIWGWAGESIGSMTVVRYNPCIMVVRGRAGKERYFGLWSEIAAVERLVLALQPVQQ